MASVALYGFAEVSREGIWQSKADEIWSVVWAYKYDIPRLDRLFEMHPVWMQAKSKKAEYQKPREHWEWLKNNRSIPVYMMANHPDVPMCIRYPIDGVMSLVPKARQRKVFTSSFDYLVSFAILEGYDRIECYGFEMGSDTEYRYQREGAAYWISQCDARGVELILPEKTALLRNKLYGYEGGSMIYRQDLERLKTQREQQKKDAFARLANIEGQLKNAPESERQEIAEKWDSQYRLCLVVSGAHQECEYLLKELDLEEPEEELIDPMSFIPLEAQ